jgi:hypothetical protein
MRSSSQHVNLMAKWMRSGSGMSLVREAQWWIREVAAVR